MLAASSTADLGEATGRVFDISKGCLDDGPGLRAVVFLQGCPLDCPWCHNPEGKGSRPAIAFHQSRCIGCGRCRKACPRCWSGGDFRQGCTACGRCVGVCPSGARRLVGRRMTTSEVLSEVVVDAPFMTATGGGVTFSGGEPLAQPGLVFSCADALRASGIHTAVETAGLWPTRLAAPLAEAVDLVLFDLKHVSLGKTRETLGADYALALENLEVLLASHVSLEIRLTLVPGFNSAAEDLEAIAEWLSRRAPDVPVRVVPFHRLGTAKEEVFGFDYPFARFAPMGQRDAATAAEVLQGAGLTLCSRRGRLC